MTSSRADTVIQAHALAIGLTGPERIALGATLVMTVLDPNEHSEVCHAARRLAEHADALLAFKMQLEIEQPDGPHSGRTITHEQMGHPAISGVAAPESPHAACEQTTFEWRAAWGRFSDSLWGDALACVGLFVGFLGIGFFMWLLSPQF